MFEALVPNLVPSNSSTGVLEQYEALKAQAALLGLPVLVEAGKITVLPTEPPAFVPALGGLVPIEGFPGGTVSLVPVEPAAKETVLDMKLQVKNPADHVSFAFEIPSALPVTKAEPTMKKTPPKVFVGTNATVKLTKPDGALGKNGLAEAVGVVPNYAPKTTLPAADADQILALKASVLDAETPEDLAFFKAKLHAALGVPKKYIAPGISHIAPGDLVLGADGEPVLVEAVSVKIEADGAAATAVEGKTANFGALYGSPPVLDPSNPLAKAFVEDLKKIGLLDETTLGAAAKSLMPAGITTIDSGTADEVAKLKAQLQQLQQADQLVNGITAGTPESLVSKGGKVEVKVGDDKWLVDPTKPAYSKKELHPEYYGKVSVPFASTAPDAIGEASLALDLLHKYIDSLSKGSKLGKVVWEATKKAARLLGLEFPLPHPPFTKPVGFDPPDSIPPAHRLALIEMLKTAGWKVKMPALPKVEPMPLPTTAVFDLEKKYPQVGEVFSPLPVAAMKPDEETMAIKIAKVDEQGESKVILAYSILKISEALQELKTSGLNEQAIIVLLRDMLPKDKKGNAFPKSDIKAVLDALAALKSTYCE